MKKTFAIILAMLMLLSLMTACSAPVAEAPAAEVPAAEAPAAEAATGYDTVEIMLSTTYNEMESSGQFIKHFADYITEKSGGAVTFNIKWGGTLAGMGEELSFLKSGAFDMSVIGQSQYSAEFPLLNFPGSCAGGQEKCMEYFRHIVYENEKTAPLIQAQIESQGVKMIGFVANGGNAFAAKKDMTTLAEMTKYKLGVGMDFTAFESVGFVVQAMMPWDAYDSISKGVVDIAYMSIGPMISLNWQEAAPYFISTNAYAAGNYFTIGLDKWNSLSADTQALFNEAMDATAAFSIELNAKQEADAATTLEAAGGKLSELNAEDTQTLAAALFNSAVTDCRALGQTANCAEDMETVLAACAEFLGMTIQ